MDWSTLYPNFVVKDDNDAGRSSRTKKMSKQVEIADIGCGFGGLLVALAPKFPESLILGMYMNIYTYKPSLERDTIMDQN